MLVKHQENIIASNYYYLKNKWRVNIGCETCGINLYKSQHVELKPKGFLKTRVEVNVKGFGFYNHNIIF